MTELHSTGSQNGHREGCGWPGSLTLFFSFLLQLCFFVHHHPCDRHIRVLLSGFPNRLSQRLPGQKNNHELSIWFCLKRVESMHLHQPDTGSSQTVLVSSLTVTGTSKLDSLIIQRTPAIFSASCPSCAFQGVMHVGETHWLWNPGSFSLWY